MSNPFDGISFVQWLLIAVIIGMVGWGLVRWLHRRFDKEFGEVSDLKDHFSHSSVVGRISQARRKAGRYSFTLDAVGFDRPIKLEYSHKARLFIYRAENFVAQLEHPIGHSLTPSLAKFEEWLLDVQPTFVRDGERAQLRSVSMQ